MTYDLKVPKPLKSTQEWFGSIIARPIDIDNKMNPISPSGHPMEKEAIQHIVPSSTLQPHERIQIYNQQYWWRLLSNLHEIFPVVTRLFGYTDFNQTIGIPYLTKYPPDHWSLNHLGNKLPQWIQEEYTANDKRLIYHAAWLDWVFSDSFVSAELPFVTEETLTHKLTLQPYVQGIILPYDLITFRAEFLKQDPDHWIENDFPSLIYAEKGSSFCFILYRTPQNAIQVQKATESEWAVLQRFRSATTIDTLCEWLETLPEGSKLVEEASRNLHLWCQRWIAYRWLGLEM